MHDAPGPGIRLRLIALDFVALVVRAAAVGLGVALVLAGATLLFSSPAEAAEPVQAAATTPNAWRHGDGA
jgi:hypothetical protein